MQPDHVLRFEPATAADLEDPLVREFLKIPEPVRLAAAAAIRIEQGLNRRLGPWVVEQLGIALGLDASGCRVAIALAGYLTRRGADGRIRPTRTSPLLGPSVRPWSPSGLGGSRPARPKHSPCIVNSTASFATQSRAENS